MNSQTSSTVNLIAEKEGKNLLSIYGGELTQQSVVKNMARIKAAFPALPIMFYDVLMDRVKEIGFSDERLADAVNNVIDNCQYPTPTMAQFLSFDKHVELYTYSQMSKMAYDFGSGVWDKHDKKKINGIVYWFRK